MQFGSNDSKESVYTAVLAALNNSLATGSSLKGVLFWRWSEDGGRDQTTVETGDSIYQCVSLCRKCDRLRTSHACYAAPPCCCTHMLLHAPAHASHVPSTATSNIICSAHSGEDLHIASLLHTLGLRCCCVRQANRECCGGCKALRKRSCLRLHAHWNGQRQHRVRGNLCVCVDLT